MNGDEDFQSSPKAVTATGREGNIIGTVRSSNIDEVNDGMIVLFSHPPSEAGVTVVLEKFEVRDSQKNPGKKYIKCFEWMTLEDFQRIKNAEMTGDMRSIRQEQFKQLAETGVTIDAGIAEKLIEASQNEVFVSLIIKGGAKAVFWDRWNFLVITEKEPVKVPILDTIDSLYVHQSNNIIYFDADSWDISQKIVEAVIIEDISLPGGNSVTTISSGKKNILLIPKEYSEIAEKLKGIAGSKLPKDMKENLIKEILKQMKGGAADD